MNIRYSTCCALMLACLVGFVIAPAPAGAVGLAVAYKPPVNGWGYDITSFYSSANTLVDKNGNPIASGLGLRQYGAVLNLRANVGDFQCGANIPYVRVTTDKPKGEDSGFGDIGLLASWYLPIKSINILPTLKLKIPVGTFDRHRRVNVDDGQFDISPQVYFFKWLDPFTFDAVLKYNIRLRNPDSDITNGNEFGAEALVSYRFIDKFHVGAGVNYLTGSDKKHAGTSVSDSGVTRVSVGGMIYYGRLEKWRFGFSAYQDVLTRNTSEGFTVGFPITFLF